MPPSIFSNVVAGPSDPKPTYHLLYFLTLWLGTGPSEGKKRYICHLYFLTVWLGPLWIVKGPRIQMPLRIFLTL